MRKLLAILFLCLGAILQGATYDCFLFFDELELLQIRLDELYNVVDYFVIVEGKESFAGKDKPLYYSENAHLFEKYQSKIIHLVVDSFPSPPFVEADEDHNFWMRENYARNYIANALKDCKDDDTIFISNIDEIPRAKSVKKIKQYLHHLNEQRKVTKVHRNLFVCELGLRWLAYNMDRENPQVWIGGCKAVPYWFLKANTPWSIRVYHFIHNCSDTKKFMDAGWYFDTMGGEKRALYKWQNNSCVFDHATLEKISADDHLLQKTLNKMRDEYTVPVRINKRYPRYFLKHIEYFRSLGWLYEK